MNIIGNKLIYIFLILCGFFLPIQAFLVFVLNMPNLFQLIYLFILIGLIICCFIPYKKLILSADKVFVVLFFCLLFSMLISIIINWHSITNYGMEFTYYTKIYSKFWDSPGMRMLNWGLIRPILFFIYILILFIFLSFKDAVKVLLKTLIILAVVSSIYSIYQVVAAYFNLPYGSIFSGHSGEEIFLFGKLRRVEGVFYEPGPQATFLSPIFCILFCQLFEPKKENRLFNKNLIVIYSLLVSLTLILTFSPIAYCTFPIAILLLILLNINNLKLHLTKKVFLFIINIFIIICITGVFLFFLIDKTVTQNFSVLNYMVEKISVSLNNIDSPKVYLNPDSRSVRNYVGLHMFMDHKIFGVGPGGGITYFFKYANFTSPKLWLRDQHAIINTHMKMLCETGILGFIFYLGILIYPIYLYLKKYRLIKYNKYIINGLLLGYCIYILISFQSTLQFWMPYFWMIYVLLVVSLKQLPQKVYILSSYSKVNMQMEMGKYL